MTNDSDVIFINTPPIKRVPYIHMQSPIELKYQDLSISVIILNYKNYELTLQCVEKVINAARMNQMVMQVIVVDNSTSETAPILKKTLPPEVQLIANEENLGFARANNLAIQQSTGKYVLLLNNDAFINSECLKTGIEFLRENTQVGIWAPQLRGVGNNIQISCAKSPSLLGVFGEYFLGTKFDWYEGVNNWSRPTRVDTVIGAFMLMPRKVISEIGLLDERFFFTVEDMDYCLRVRNAGYSIVYDPRVSVRHVGSASQSHKNWNSDPYLHNNRILYFEIHHGKYSARIARMIIEYGLAYRRLKNRIW